MQNLLLDGTLAALFTCAFAGIGGCLIFLKKDYSQNNINFMLNMAAGVMLASSVFTLLAPAAAHVNQIETNHYLGGLLICLALLAGVGLIWVLHEIVPHEHECAGKEGLKMEWNSSWLFVLAIAIHKMPEGLAVGVAYAGQELFDPKALAVGIALQNIPEGLMVAVSLVAINFSKVKAALAAAVTGLIQPVGAVIGILATGFSSKMIPFGMAMAGGTMMFVIINEVIPEVCVREGSKKSSAAILAGFIFMTYLSIVLG